MRIDPIGIERESKAEFPIEYLIISKEVKS